MTIDKAKLKVLAESAGMAHGWYQETSFGLRGVSGRSEQAFISAASPSAILALLAEIEGLTAQHGRDSAELRRLCQARDDARKERDQLKAENEQLRREREGKVLCDLDLFETLRDSANTEADEHRQCMATYRPLRQENLDAVVKKCDDLLAALAKEASR